MVSKIHTYNLLMSDSFQNMAQHIIGHYTAYCNNLLDIFSYFFCLNTLYNQVYI